jgi:hypothetical protein
MSIHRRIEVLTRLLSALSRARGDAGGVLDALANGFREYMDWPAEGWVPVREGDIHLHVDEDGSAHAEVDVSVEGHKARIELRVALGRDDRASIEIAERNWSVTLSHVGSLQQVYEEAADKLQHMFGEMAGA